MLCCARLLFVYWVAYYAQWIQIKWRIFRCVFFFGANIVDSSRKWPPKWIDNLALKLKMFQVQFVFVVCSACWRLPFWMLKRSALNIFDNWILFFNFFFWCYFADKKCSSSQSCVILFIFPSIFNERIRFRNEIRNELFLFRFSAINQTREIRKKKKKTLRNETNLPESEFLLLFLLLADNVHSFSQSERTRNRERMRKRTFSDGKSDGKIIYLISSLDLDHKI